MKQLAIFLFLIPLTAIAAVNPYPENSKISKFEIKAFNAFHSIKVRIAESKATLEIKGFDLVVGDYFSNLKSKWDLRCHNGRIDGVGPGGRRISQPEPLVIESQSGILRVNSKPYREKLEIYSTGSFCEAINVLDLEKYLEGLVNAEFKSSWNQEAVGAQIIAARTYALYQMFQARKESEYRFDVDATVKDQVYSGFGIEDLKAAQLVQKTRGQVLLVANKMPLKAFYHSTCGGATELPERVWGNRLEGYQKSVTCPYCSVSPSISWEADVSEVDIKKNIIHFMNAEILENSNLPKGWSKDTLKNISRSQLTGLKSVLARSGRVAELHLVWRSGDVIVTTPLTGQRIREILGYSKIKSTAFIAKKTNNGIKFIGKGNGHGVGMCQWGAKVMGEKGISTQKILGHYYPAAKITRVW